MDSPAFSSPFKTVLDTVGKTHEKALKQAFYNTAALIFAFLCSLGLIIAYYVLEPFLRPLVWAALCGTFLYPFKKTLTIYVKGILQDLEETETPIAIGVALIPFKTLDRTTEYLHYTITSYWKSMLGSCFIIAICYYLIIFHPFYQIFTWIEYLCTIVVKMLSFFDSPFMAWSMFVGFWVIVLFLHTPSQDEEKQSQNFVFQNISIVIWLIMAFHFISLAGVWRIPLVLLMVVLITLGFVGERKNKSECTAKPSKKPNDNTIKFVVDRTLTVFGIPIHKLNQTESQGDFSRSNSTAELSELDHSPVESLSNSSLIDTTSTPVAELINPSIEALKSPLIIKKSISITPKVKKTSEKIKPVKKRKCTGSSDPYFIALFWGFAISRVWLNLWIIQILPIFIVFYVLKRILIKLEAKEFVLRKIKDLRIYSMLKERSDIIIPSPVRATFMMMHIGDRKILGLVTISLDKLISVFIILCLIMGTLTGAAFFAVQVHHESSYLITVATDVMNKSVTSNQEYLRYLNINDSDIRATFDSTVHSAYMLGRKKMASFVSSSISNDQVNNTDMEVQITQFLDQLYDTWFLKKNVSAKSKQINQSLNKTIQTNDTSNPTVEGQGSVIKRAYNKVTTMLKPSDMGKLADILKENIHTLHSVLDSIWAILKGNVNLVFSVITHIVSMVFFSGTYLLNAVLSTVIFTTTLFYLLSGSSNEYKLVEWFSGVSMGTKLGESISKAIQDVFGAALKMAMFYGFYTWFTHSVFGANLVFIPAALAALLGVVPFIGTYWAAVPAALELWLLQNDWIMAVLLIAVHMLPTYVVDTAIYSEIGGGGHPYLTGLAVAGGVYCIGLEGAFIGPIVLCCLIAAFHVYYGIMSEDGDNSRAKPSSTKTASTTWRRALSEDC